jgi:hypothetical protein
VRCLVDPAAPDVFGQGWFGRHGIGFPAWWALILVEEAAGWVSVSDLVACAGGLAVERLVQHQLLTIRGGHCRRGPAKLIDVAIELLLLGSTRLRMTEHAVGRERYRDQLELGQSRPRTAGVSEAHVDDHTEPRR